MYEQFPINAARPQHAPRKVFQWAWTYFRTQSARSGRGDFWTGFKNLTDDMEIHLTSRFCSRRLSVRLNPRTLNPYSPQISGDTGYPAYGRMHLLPFLGRSILLADGTAWAHARAMLRPAFSKKQITDLEMFDVHVESLITAIKDKGSILDL